jgi:hypothetical protein
MVLPKNAVHFSSFFKYAFSLITTHKSHCFSVESSKITRFV